MGRCVRCERTLRGSEEHSDFNPSVGAADRPPLSGITATLSETCSAPPGLHRRGNTERQRRLRGRKTRENAAYTALFLSARCLRSSPVVPRRGEPGHRLCCRTGGGFLRDISETNGGLMIDDTGLFSPPRTPGGGKSCPARCVWVL